jgi:hypothetical protein
VDMGSKGAQHLSKQLCLLLLGSWMSVVWRTGRAGGGVHPLYTEWGVHRVGSLPGGPAATGPEAISPAAEHSLLTRPP